MKYLPVFTLFVAVAIAGGEIARWWGDPRFLPLAFDELLVAAGLIVGLFSVRRYGPAPLATAWGGYTGFMLSLLVPTLDHLLFGPPKPSAIFYSVVLGAMFTLGLIGLWASLRLCRQRAR